LQKYLLSEAQKIYDEDVEMCRKIGINGEKLIPDGGAILTHCNAGALATAGDGTALAPVFEAQRNGKKITVYVDETRPVLQGARLTAWELKQAGIDAVLICDNMAGVVMKEGKVNAVFVGADRIAANGDTANKIGTYSLSVLAKEHKLRFETAKQQPDSD
jgi:methylthioribose-1-phosphate isomerase